MGMAQNVWIAFVELGLGRGGAIGVGKTPAAALERFDRNFTEVFCQKRQQPTFGKGADEKTTKRLLLDIGARASEDGQPKWGLR
jgi:hypothetical protein